MILFRSVDVTNVDAELDINQMSCTSCDADTQVSSGFLFYLSSSMIVSRRVTSCWCFFWRIAIVQLTFDCWYPYIVRYVCLSSWLVSWARLRAFVSCRDEIRICVYYGTPIKKITPCG